MVLYKIDNRKRYQKGLCPEHLFPTVKGICACGCSRELPKIKRKWFSKECLKKSLDYFYTIKGDTKEIRRMLFEKDKGFCRNCGVYDPKWEADHIIPVCLGGGGCSIDNFQTLCKDCHKEKGYKI